MSNIKFSGTVGKDAELRFTAQGDPQLSFTVSLYTGGNKKDGYKDSEWVRVMAFKEVAEQWQEKIHKGDVVTITGQPMERKEPFTWTDSSGKVRPQNLTITAHVIAIGDEFRVDQQETNL